MPRAPFLFSARERVDRATIEPASGTLEPASIGGDGIQFVDEYDRDAEYCAPQQHSKQRRPDDSHQSRTSPPSVVGSSSCWISVVSSPWSYSPAKSCAATSVPTVETRKAPPK